MYVCVCVCVCVRYFFNTGVPKVSAIQVGSTSMTFTTGECLCEVYYVNVFAKMNVLLTG